MPKNGVFGSFSYSVAAQLPSPRGQFRKREKNPSLLWGRGNLGGILRDNLGEGNCESKIAARSHSRESIFAARHQDVSQGPLGTRVKRVPFVLLFFFAPVLQYFLFQNWPFSF